jgi:hypothetical protein
MSFRTLLAHKRAMAFKEAFNEIMLIKLTSLNEQHRRDEERILEMTRLLAKIIEKAEGK